MSVLNQLGVAITILQSAVLVIAFFRHQQRPFALHGWIGLLGLLTAEALLFSHVQIVAIYFTPIAWTCYILLIDAAVLAITGHSRLHDHPARLSGVALLSIPLWLIFEGYNLRLQNWTYAGVQSQFCGAMTNLEVHHQQYRSLSFPFSTRRDHFAACAASITSGACSVPIFCVL